MKNPKASIMIITYNHEQFIAQAIESALMQQTDFPYEIIIGEDCSTDRTREIVIGFQRRYPDRIRLLLSERNQGQAGKVNFVRTFSECRGEYLAILEGDDYWTSPNKLQRQVNFLEAHTECSICFHGVTVFDESQGSKVGEIKLLNASEVFPIEDIIVDTYLHTASVVLRRELLPTLPEWFNSVLNGDTALYFLYGDLGPFGYINQDMATYRVHSGGIWAGMNIVRRIQELIKTYTILNKEFNYKYSKTIKAFLKRLYFNLALAYENNGHDYVSAKKWLFECIKERPLSNKFLPRTFVLSMMLRLYLPNLHRAGKAISKYIGRGEALKIARPEI